MIEWVSWDEKHAPQNEYLLWAFYHPMADGTWEYGGSFIAVYRFGMLRGGGIGGWTPPSPDIPERLQHKLFWARFNRPEPTFPIWEGLADATD